MASVDLPAEDGHAIRLYTWWPDSRQAPAALVHVFHGLGEHAGRYERFARACNAANLAVVAHNHRGHGETAELAGHFADHDGWDRVIGDALLVQARSAQDWPGVPIVLLGHSMGSYIAQSFVMRHPESVTMLVLSASTLAPRSQLRTGHLLACVLAFFGKRRKSALLNRMGLGEFNRAFEPVRTAFDWLSRDTSEVDRYLADPYCGGEFSNRFWCDLTGGLLQITSMQAIARVPAQLPILIMGGEQDPVGGARGLARLVDAYRQSGHDNVELLIYDGGRHEMLNETNRDEVTADIIDRIKQKGVRAL